MRQERFKQPHALGIERLTGDNSGLLYANERTEQVPVRNEQGKPTGETETEYVYDVYELPDARNPRKVKNDVIEDQHPNGDELKILRKTIAKLLKETGLYDLADYAEFKAYNEFAESI